MGAAQKVTFCRICEAHCGLIATVEDERVVKLRPDPDHPLSRGYACPKGIAMLDVQNDPDRVVHPSADHLQDRRLARTRRADHVASGARRWCRARVRPRHSRFH